MAYPRQLTMEKITEAGLSLLAQDGEVGLRPLARKLGVQAPSLYRYFRSKQALAKLLAAEGYKRLGDDLRTALSKDKDLLSLAHAYRNFALKNPQLYHLMYRPGLEPEDESPEADHAIKPLAELLGQERDNPTFVKTFRALRAFVHGFISMEMAGQFTHEGNPEEAYEAGLSLMSKALAKGRTLSKA